MISASGFQRKRFKNLKKCTKLTIIPLKIGVAILS